MIFLIGFMGSGKTTAGRELARRLACPFIDLDERIERRAGRSIPEIFDRQGEAAFRDLEHAELSALFDEIGGDQAVVALGGGAFAQPRNIALIEERGGFSAWLDAPVGVLLERCRAHDTDRPLARDEARFRALHEARLPFYARARLRVDATAAPAIVVEEIMSALARWRAPASGAPESGDGGA